VIIEKNFKKIRSKLDSTTESALINLCIKPIGMILGLVYTPLLLNYLGTEKYGLYATMISIISWINYLDIGIGNGLRNLLSKELAGEQLNEAKKSVSTAYIMLSAVSSMLLLVLIVGTLLLDWNDILKTNIDMQLPLLISFLFICINFVLALCNTLLYALQLSERVSLRNVTVQIFNICGIIILQTFSEGNLMYISILFGLSTCAVYIGNSIQIMNKYKYLRPSLKYYDKTKISAIGNLGLKFFVIQIAYMAMYTTDNLLITNLFSASEVTPFNITYGAFNTVYAFFAALLVPFWSQTTVAIQKRDINWVKKAIRKLNFIALIFSFCYIILAFAFKPLAKIWLGQNLDYPSGLIELMCLYYMLYTFSAVYSQILNGTGKINGPLFLSVFQGIINIPLAIFLAKTCGLGVAGIRLATTILVGIGSIYLPINTHIVLKKLKGSDSNSTIT
jgi:O-antigen/teichoic acid export membrane protein